MQSKLSSSTMSRLGDGVLLLGNATKIEKAKRVRKAAESTTTPRQSKRIKGLDPEFGNSKSVDLFCPYAHSSLRKSHAIGSVMLTSLPSAKPW